MQVPAYVSLRIIAGCYLQPAFPGARPLIRWTRSPAVHLTSPPGGARSAGTSPLCWPEPPRGQFPPTYPRRRRPLQGQRSWFICGGRASSPHKTTRHLPGLLLFSLELILARALTAGPWLVVV